MIKKIVNRLAKVEVKTNVLKNGECYFSGQDPAQVVQVAYNEVEFERPSTQEEFAIKLFDKIKEHGIAPYMVEYGTVKYFGGKITNKTEKDLEQYE